MPDSEKQRRHLPKGGRRKEFEAMNYRGHKIFDALGWLSSFFGKVAHAPRRLRRYDLEYDRNMDGGPGTNSDQ